MPTPEQEAQETPIVADDKSAISKLMEGVADDGFAPEPTPPAQNENGGLETEIETPAGGAATDPQESAIDVLPAEPSQESAQPSGDAPQDDYEREIDAYEAPKGASVRTTEVLKILKTKNREEHRARKAAEAEKVELSKRELLDETTKQELVDLRKIRDELAVEHSPFFKQYSEEVARHETDAIGLLRNWKLPEETAKFISDNGGLLKFQSSDDLMPVGVQVEGKPVTHAQWWAQVVKPMLNEAQKDELNDHLFEARKAIRDRNAAVNKAKTNPQEFFAKQQAEIDKGNKDYRDKADKQLQLEATLYGDIAKRLETPSDATTEQKVEIDKHNARLESAGQDALRWMNDHTPEAEVSKALARVYRDMAQERVKELEASNKEIQTKLNDLQTKWETMRKSKETSRQQATVQQQKPTNNQPRRGFSSDDDTNAMRDLLKEVPI